MRKHLLLLILCMFMVLVGCKEKEIEEPKKEDNTPPVVEDNKPIFSDFDDLVIEVGTDFSFFSDVQALDIEDGDISEDIIIDLGTYEEGKEGNYIITYQVTDSGGNTTYKDRVVIVYKYEYANGVYNFRQSPFFTRVALIAAAEKWAIDNLSAGIPMFSSASYQGFSNRVMLRHSEYYPIVGFDTSLARLTEDDSSIEFLHGIEGEIGEYTFRSYIDSNHYDLNPLEVYSGNDEFIMSLISAPLYEYRSIGGSKRVYYTPVLAEGEPVAVNPEINDYGMPFSDVWQFNIKDDLTWYFHPNTPSEFFDQEIDYTLNARDIYDTIKIAYEEQFEFIYTVYDVKNLNRGSNYETVPFDDVGISVLSDEYGNETILEIEFEDVISLERAKYVLSQMVLPMNLDLYNYSKDLYGSSPEYIAYAGPYYIEEANDEYILLQKSVEYFENNRYSIDRFLFSVIEDYATRFELLESGLIDQASIPTNNLDDSSNLYKKYIIPGLTVYKLAYNGLKTIEKQQELFPDSTFVPEPIIGHELFRKALYHAINRQELAGDILKSRLPANFYIPMGFMIDTFSGVAYRNSIEGLEVFDYHGGESYGYDEELAKTYFKQAVADLIEEGYYQKGTKENPTEIVIELNIYNNSESWEQTGAYLKSMFENTFVDDENHVVVRIDVSKIGFPSIYYDHMMIGEFDLSVAGISVYSSDTGMMLSWTTNHVEELNDTKLSFGADSSIAEIKVEYVDQYGKKHYEIWSLDALVKSLAENTAVHNGTLPPSDKIEVVTYSPTSVTVEINEEFFSIFDEISYSLEWYDVNTQYQPVEGHQNVLLDDHMITIEGLQPGFDDYPTLYRGDYQITLYCTMYGSDSVIEYTLPWWLNPSTIESYSIETEVTNGIVTLELHDLYEGVLIEAIPLMDYDELAPSYELTENGFIIPNYSSEYFYYVKLIYDDGTIDYIIINQ